MKSLCKNTDHELIHSFMDGDMNSLETLVVRHKDKLYTSILFLVKDKYLAEDIFQDVLIKIMTPSGADVTLKKVNFYPGPCVLHTIFV